MRKKPIWILMLLISLLAVSLLVSGCGKIAEKASEEAAEKAIEQASGGKADVELDKDGNFEVKTEDGTIKAGSTEWPESMPTDVPRFTDGKITSVMENKTGDNSTAYVIGIEETSLDAVEKYKSELEKNGWSIAFTSNTEDSVMFSAENNKRTVTATFTVEEGKKASGGITYGEEQ